MFPTHEESWNTDTAGTMGRNAGQSGCVISNNAKEMHLGNQRIDLVVPRNAVVVAIRFYRSTQGPDLPGITSFKVSSATSCISRICQEQ